MPQRDKTYLKIASVSLNQTVYDWAENIKNIQRAIDQAASDHADILSTEELSLVGYPADDYHQWNKDNALTWQSLQYLAAYAAQKAPNLVVTVGVPWHYADKTKSAIDPEYNISNRPYNVHAVITKGRVVAMAAKSILADGATEYETRQFASWPAWKEVVRLSLPDGTKIPFGKPVIALEDGTKRLTLAYEICAEGWPGLQDDLTINAREQREARYLVTQAAQHDLSVVLNPSASKPEPAINKERIRAEGLCATGSRHCGVYVYTNCLGSSSGTYGAEGSQLFAQDGRIIHHGYRYSFKDMSYSSLVTSAPPALRGAPHVVIQHPFMAEPKSKGQGREAPFDLAYGIGLIGQNELAYEEYLRSIALWLRDYMAKQTFGPQGYVVSLSGGKDSAYGALAVSTMVDLDVQENGIDGFFRRFAHLTYRDEVLKIQAEKGEAAAVRALKRRLLTCVYIPTDNSSPETERAARFLVEGGTLPNGQYVDGLGGKFFIAPVQSAVDETTLAIAGVNIDQIVRDNLDEILQAVMESTLPQQARYDLARASLLRQIKTYVNATPGTAPMLPAYLMRALVNPLVTWASAADDITLQNIQARVRLPIPWAIGNQERKIPLATSNESESVLSYTTAGGDMHMGGANPIGGVPKHVITQSLRYFETKGPVGLTPVKALYWINQQEPTAELRRVAEDGARQTDETDLGFTYQQSQFIEKRLIVGRQSPTEVFAQMRADPLFGDNPAMLRDILVCFVKRWESGQFKRIMAPLSPHVGSNADPHQAVRTTVLGDHFRTSLAQMTLDLLAELCGGVHAFETCYGVTIKEAKWATLIDGSLKNHLASRPIHTLNGSLFRKRLLSVSEDISCLINPKRPEPNHGLPLHSSPSPNPNGGDKQ